MKDKARELGCSVMENVPICNAKAFGILLKGNKKLTKGSSREVTTSEEHFLNAPSDRGVKDRLDEDETGYRERNQVALGQN